MIISASRRTDIPAFYSDWFFKRIKEGYVLVRNPMNHNIVSKVNLKPEVVDCIVLWTKDPRNMLQRLDRLNRYKYYFQFTLNPYDKEIEPYLPDKEEIIDTFIMLSEKIGRNRVIWRYDPILLSDKIDKDYHLKSFEFLAQKLRGHTEKCMISFVDLYRNVQNKVKQLKVRVPDETEMREMAAKFAEVGRAYGIKIETCAEKADLSELGVSHGKCIDDNLISDLLGKKINPEKDKRQRDACG